MTNNFEAKQIVNKYNELNKNTVEKVTSYDPKLKIRVLTKIKIDENAVKMSEFIKQKESDKKKEQNIIKKSQKLPKKELSDKKDIKPKERKKRPLIDVNSLYYKLGIAYFETGISLEQLALENKINYASARQNIYFYAGKKGIKMAGHIPKHKLNDVIEMYKSGAKLQDICKQVKLTQNKVKKILTDSGIEVNRHNYKMVKTNKLQILVEKLINEGLKNADICERLTLTKNQLQHIKSKIVNKNLCN